MDANSPTGYAQVVEELRGGQVFRQYAYGTDLISERQVINNQWSVSYYGFDGHGSVRFLTDQTGTVTDSYTYDAFGTLIEQSGATPNEYLYAGERYDSETGMYYLRARYMQPQTGRFWTMDSFEGSPFDPASLHKYSYVSGNPVNGIDPSGHEELTIGGNMGALAVAMVVVAMSAIAYVQTKDKIRDALEDLTYSTPGPLVAPTPSPSPEPEQESQPEPHPVDPPSPPDDRKGQGVNMDTGAMIDLVAEGSPVRQSIRAYIGTKTMYLCFTALAEFQGIVNRHAGPHETDRANRLLNRITLVPDNPSPRALALRETRKVGANDKIIFGTGDSLGVETLTTDLNFISGARAQGVSFRFKLYSEYRLTGR